MGNDGADDCTGRNRTDCTIGLYLLIMCFLALAGLNEVLRHTLEFGDWIAAKLWLFLPLSFLFTFAQLPMLMKHGLAQEAEDEVLSDPPHE